jgi:hypothetical protein
MIARLQVAMIGEAQHVDMLNSAGHINTQQTQQLASGSPSVHHCIPHYLIV